MKTSKQIIIQLETWNGKNHLSIKENGKYVFDTDQDAEKWYKVFEKSILDKKLMFIDNQIHGHRHKQTARETDSSKANTSTQTKG